MTLSDHPGQSRTRIYIGESDNLRRRLGTNYRSPGPSQQTSLRVNAFLREHLGDGGAVRLSIATEAICRIAGGKASNLDLTRKAGRLFAENAALVAAHIAGEATIENLG